MLILECSQGCDGRTDGRTDGRKDGRTDGKTEVESNMTIRDIEDSLAQLNISAIEHDNKRH